jgi:hypothetical protein
LLGIIVQDLSEKLARNRKKGGPKRRKYTFLKKKDKKEGKFCFWAFFTDG